MENIKYKEVLGRISMFSSKELFLGDWVICVYYFLNMLLKCLLDAAKLFSANNQFIMDQSFTDIQLSGWVSETDIHNFEGSEKIFILRSGVT